MAPEEVEAVVRRVMWLIKDSQTKVLVFSTWAEVLQLLEHALKTNHVPCMRAKSRDALEGAIKEFRKPVQKGKLPLQTLLLLLKQGGNGLNLTEAQHVIMMEPIFDPAVEQQAIGRIHRIGQTHDTTVHRFVVEKSVEQNVHRICSARVAAMDMRGASKAVETPLTVRDVALLLDESWGAHARPANEEQSEAGPSSLHNHSEEGPSGLGTT
ncbi:g8256 [Coccomyxa viridis]|uniref:G8256 protein n=1 Tax=Coccomyxa viridis TaxID=1274662 RepID=A0ABP1G020_9CHLO